ncbi:flagellar biosynthetic protein FliR [Spirochaetes bacterium]|uniref:Flagellar biosynthetic protein FliR n=1 Tax=Candidatus Scatousia excrementipullorum TaxID=2840936 RepID=A0A9D9DPU6_9BACT|nr:flagellar biosynthetic protein FliR [Candidatus Scatousia excrementipullorum]
MEQILAELAKLFPQLNAALAAGIYIFARMLGFFRYAPVFNRKEIPGLVKLSLALLMTIIMTSLMAPSTLAGTNDSLLLSILLNFAVGAMIGYMAQLILIAVDAGADMINMQMGLSSAMVLDPTSNSQVSILTKLFSLLGVLIFIHLGGIYWLIKAFMRSFEIFPLFATSVPLSQLINIDYLIKMTSNVLFMGLQIASPILLATLGQDIILGVISKTAPQVNVFQLSFLFKPVLGAAIMVWILPMLLNVICDYFLSYARIF